MDRSFRRRLQDPGVCIHGERGWWIGVLGEGEMRGLRDWETGKGIGIGEGKKLEEQGVSEFEGNVAEIE